MSEETVPISWFNDQSSDVELEDAKVHVAENGLVTIWLQETVWFQMSPTAAKQLSYRLSRIVDQIAVELLASPDDLPRD